MTAFLARACFLLAAVAVATPVRAELYRWVDDAGGIHVTDDPLQVPPERRGQARVTQLKGKRMNILSAEGSGRPVGGGGLFALHCGKCHLASMESTGEGEGGDGKLGLLPFLVDPETRLPMSKEDAMKLLSSAVEGRFSDMPAMDVPPEDLERIADYLMSKLR